MTRQFRFHSPKPKKARPEARLQKAIIQHLRLTGMPGVLYFSIPNEGKRSPAACAELKLMGLLPGAADLCIIVDGIAHFMEVKSMTGGQSVEQAAFEECCFNAGCYYVLVRHIDQARRALWAWNAIRPDARRVA